MFGCQRLAETSMMRPSCQDPGGSGRLQVGLRPPHSPGDRKPGQGLMRRYHLYRIDEHAEAITHIHYRSIDGRPRPGIKHQPHWIRLASNGERVNFERWLLLGDGGTHLQHVGSKPHHVVLTQMIGVVFHEGHPTIQASAHHLHRAHQCSSLPVSLSTKAIVLRHQSLDRETRELCEAVQILEVGGEAFEIALFEKMPQPGLNAGAITQGLVLTAIAEQRWRYVI